MEMRRADLAVTGVDRLSAILEAAQVGHLGLVDDEGVYVVPRSFAHRLRDDGGITVYVHGAREGRTMAGFAARPDARICFQAEVRHATTGLDSPTVDSLSVRYESVIGWGPARLVDDPDEALAAGRALVEKYAPGRGRELLAPLPAHVAIVALDLDDLTGKARNPEA